ncbi:Arc family DNA-binding protein [Vibrio diazotrophicus]|uniref:Arc-like DNA binding domain-containing protein n=1 Tax=Vibrio diazotrophicus TaxID=685 RepID=A0ABX4W7A0_VIBDI|nr:Arc family DNA-binding protein [Vibrio diazotrophicus]PNH99619.1 hypothetical protein C1O25_16275 [Vibrio diazotrophicus]
MEEFIARYSLRLPTALKNYLERLAKANGRSLNNEIVAILEEHAEPYNKGYQTQRIVTHDSTYIVRDVICNFIRDEQNITGALFAVRDGDMNTSALTVVLYQDEKKTIFDSCPLTAERRPREREIYNVCDTLDSKEVFTNTRFVIERVPSTNDLEPEEAIELLEGRPSQLLANDENIYRFLSLFCYTDNVSQISPTYFLKDWRYLCGLPPLEDK